MPINPLDLVNGIEFVRNLTKGKEEKLEQQTIHPWLPSLDDEAILAALDAKVDELHPGSVRLLTLVRKAVTPQERERWRKIVASIKLTERHESFTVNEKASRKEYAPNDPQVMSQRRRGQSQQSSALRVEENSDKTFERKSRDYEYTAEDPRIQHYIYVAGLVKSEIPQAKTGKKISAARIKRGEEMGVAKAVEYLRTDFFVDQAIFQEFLKDANAFAKNTLNGAGHIVYRLHLGDEYERIMTSAKSDERKLVMLTEALRKKTKRVRDEIAANKKGLRCFFSNPAIAGGAVFAAILLCGMVVSALSLLS